MNRIVLVTGGCGFIGSHFINTLIARTNHLRIINMDALYACADTKRINKAIRENYTRYTFEKANLQNLQDIQQIFKRHGNVTHVVHFAAQSHVQTSFVDALQYTRDNVMGTHNLLECVRHCSSLVKMIHVSTDEVYGDSELGEDTKPMTEMSVRCPSNPYAATKAAAEMLVMSYVRSFNLPIITTRGNNVYGPGQHAEKLIPHFIGLVREGKKMTVHGDGGCIRSFLYIDDTVEAFLTLLCHETRGGEVYNIGGNPDMEKTVLDVAGAVVRVLKGSTVSLAEHIEYVEDRPYNDKRYFICSDKLKALGWKPLTSFEEGMQRTIHSFI